VTLLVVPSVLARGVEGVLVLVLLVAVAVGEGRSGSGGVLSMLSSEVSSWGSRHSTWEPSVRC